jgi:hypothetical protein
MADTKLEIEISNGAKDLDLLKGKALAEIEDLSLIIFKPVSLKFLRDFKNLKRLMVAGSVKDYSPIADCSSLEILHLSGGTIDELDFIKPLSIHTLTLEVNKSKGDTLIVPHLPALENIHITQVASIVDLSFLSDFVGLKHIALFHLKSDRLFDFSKLEKLEQLYLTNMFNLKELSHLKSIRALQLLYIHQFFINRKVKIDVKAALLKIAPALTGIETIKLKINEDEYINRSGAWL